MPASSESSGAEKFTPDPAVKGPETFATGKPSIEIVEAVTPVGSTAFQLILAFDSDTTTLLSVGPTLVCVASVKVEVKVATSASVSVAVIVKVCGPALNKPSEAEKFALVGVPAGPLTVTAWLSMVSVEPATPAESATFQVIVPSGPETLIALMTGGESAVEPTLKSSLKVEVTWAPSVAVIVMVWVPSARLPSGPEKFTPPVEAVNGPATPATAMPSMASVELTTPLGSTAFQLTRPVASETTT